MLPWDENNTVVECMVCGKTLLMNEAHGTVTEELVQHIRGELKDGKHFLEVINKEEIGNGGFYCSSEHAVASEL